MFHQSGNLAVASGLAVVIAVWSFYNQLTLVKLAADARRLLRVECLTFGDVCTLYLGRAGGIIGSTNLVIQQVAMCSTYLVFIGTMVNSATQWASSTTIVFGVLPFFFLLTLLPDASYLAPLSSIGNIVLLAAVGVCLDEIFTKVLLVCHPFSLPSVLLLFFVLSFVPCTPPSFLHLFPSPCLIIPTTANLTATDN